MSDDKPYLVVRVKIAPLLIKDFNEYWMRDCLPFWVKHGAKYINSFINYCGGFSNEIFRLFQFESISDWDHFEKELAESEEGKAMKKELYSTWNIIVERRLLKSI